ncbi:MAG TPA: Cache 3/Cache 2 fusion domain-containing protein [Spirochaetota bacterium]|nr:Cache 3/Cache 2 fusion domain-containing protein [Spirochaetota bacterium]
MIFTGCATKRPVTSDRIKAEMAAIIRNIATDRTVMNSLREKRVGKTGFYYVLGADARVVFHPRQALIGTSFSKTWFVSQLLTRKTGCLTYTLGNRTHFLFFSPINDSEILCLSIVSEDIPQPVECEAAWVR